MREIKFRVWNGYRIISDEILRKNIEEMYTRLGMRNQYMGDIMIPNNEDLVVMQYTGLKDKNGKEIYEGDIVKYEKRHIERRGKIIFGLYDEYLQYDLGFYVKWFNSNDITEDLSEIREDLGYLRKEIEVVGNICENKELLD